jgi:hypothetical protein
VLTIAHRNPQEAIMLSHTPRGFRRTLHDALEASFVIAGAVVLSGPFGILLYGFLLG